MFARCQLGVLVSVVLLPVNRPLFPPFGESRAPGLSRSHLDSAVELGSSYPIPRQDAYPFPVLLFFIPGLLSVAILSASIVGSVSHPVETGLLIPSVKFSCRHVGNPVPS